MDSYGRIRKELDKIPWLDAHSHVLHHAISGPITAGKYPVYMLSRLLLDFNVRVAYLAAGLSPRTVAEILAGSVPPEEQKSILLAYPGVRNHLMYIHLMKGLRELYGLEVWQLDSDNWELCEEALQGSRADFYSLLAQVYEKGNISASVLNLWADLGKRYVSVYREGLTPRQRCQDAACFRFSATLDYRALYPFGPLAAEYAREFSVKTDTLEDYLQLLERVARWFVEEKGACGLKITEMYYRRLDYQIRSFEEAAACYLPDPTPQQEQVLSDFVACQVFRLAAELNVPVQIHTGSLWGEFAVEDVNPAYLAPVIAAFPNTKFDLLHGGDPFFGISMMLAEDFSNVYLNLAALPLNAYDLCKTWLSQYLDKVPSTKISLGWDVFSPELVCGAACYSRDIVAQVLAQKVDAGLYSMELALDVAHDLMHRTAESLYPRRDTLPTV